MKRIRFGVVATLILYAFLTCYFYLKIPTNIKFLDQTMEQISYRKVDESLTKIVNNFEFTIKEESEVNLLGKQLGIQINDDVESMIKDIDYKLSWFLNYSHNITKDAIIVDEDIITEQLDKTVNNGKASKDAKVVYSDGEYIIEEEVMGTFIDTDIMAQDIKQEILLGNTSIDAKNYYKKPSIYKKDLEEEKEILNKLIDKDYSVIIGDNVSYFTKEQISNTLIINNDGTYKFDDRLVYDMLAGVSSQFTSTKKVGDTLVTTLYPVDEAVDEFINIANSETKNVEIILEKEVISKAEKQKADPKESTYIEVNKESQHLWYYKDGKLALETPVITGNEANDWGTVEGEFNIMSKEENAMLDGSTVGFEYMVEVEYWMPISSDGTGIHDGSWIEQSDFGTDRYKTNGSHGCVTLPPDKMEQLYEIVDVGTKVYVTK